MDVTGVTLSIAETDWLLDALKLMPAIKQNNILHQDLMRKLMASRDQLKTALKNLAVKQAAKKSGAKVKK